MSDQITTIGKSLVQHGKDSDRVYLMKLHPSDAETIVDKLLYLANINQYSKIFCKVPAECEDPFIKNGFIKEASIPDFYQGKDGVSFYSLFLNEQRSQVEKTVREEINKNLNLARENQKKSTEIKKDNVTIQNIRPNEVNALAELYKKVFPSYPFPIHDPDYLLETMKSHVDYYGIWEDDSIVAAASAEKDTAGQNAEMTDFATLPEYRGRGYASVLLDFMESPLKEENIQTLFTIARAYSAGMNITFAKLGYTFSGTLVNNTQISGTIESMNVWYKKIVLINHL